MAEISWPWQYNFPPFFTSWKYINEGNAHIVIELIDTNYVIRLIKLDGKPIFIEHIKKSLDFVNLVMVPLSKNHYYGIGEIAELPNDDLVKLSQELQQYRPQKRLNKSSLSPYAIKTTNLSIVSPKCESNYCVEIKPKEGYLASSLKIYSKCYYCIKQYLKIETQDIVQTSGYCPLDLFSGDRQRMKESVLHMIKNPQNNFKLFKDGKLLYHEKLCNTQIEDILSDCTQFESKSVFVNFVVEVLLSERDKSNNIVKEETDIPTNVVKNPCNECNKLKPNNILYNLLELQKLSEKVTYNTDDITDQHFTYVQKLLDELSYMSLDFNNQQDRVTYFKTANPIHLALISAVARDCSIMISFSPDYVANMPFVDVQQKNGSHSRLYYKMTLTDLEPKPIETLLKRKYTERRMIEAYANAINKEIQCKIQPHSETRAKQLEAWQTLIIEYLKMTKQSTVDVRESQNSPLFNNAEINRKLTQEAILTILDDMAKSGRAAPIDKSKNVWEIYWHSLDEWGNMVYNWACNNGMNNSVCTLFELREGDNTADEEFHGLDLNVLMKALKTLESKGRCELMEFDDNQGVKFF